MFATHSVRSVEFRNDGQPSATTPVVAWADVRLSRTQTVFPAVTSSLLRAGVARPGTTIVGSGDLNSDGYPDLVLQVGVDVFVFSFFFFT